MADPPKPAGAFVSGPPATLSGMDRTFLTGVPGAGELILVRHGQQDFPPTGTADMSLWVDPPLSALGQRQAKAVGTHLASAAITAVYSSRLERARVTGQAIADAHGLEVHVDDRLREIEMFSRLPEGMRGPVEAFGVEKVRAAQDAFETTRRWDSFPGSEHGPEFRARVREVLEEIVRAHPGEVVVAACHGGVINAYVAEVLGVGEDMFYRPAHASVHRVAYLGERRVIHALNEIPHLLGDGLLSC